MCVKGSDAAFWVQCRCEGSRGSVTGGPNRMEHGILQQEGYKCKPYAAKMQAMQQIGFAGGKKANKKIK